MIKVHPFTHPFAALKIGVSSSERKCALGAVKKFTRAVLLVRDPYDAIWKEYSRQKTGSHVLKIQKGKLNLMEWLSQSVGESQ
jgi:hypothetical protein